MIEKMKMADLTLRKALGEQEHREEAETRAEIERRRSQLMDAANRVRTLFPFSECETLEKSE